MRVRDLLRQKPSKVITVESGEDLGTVARTLIEHGVGGAPVVSPGGASVVGFAAERDVVHAIVKHPEGVHQLHVDSVMQRPAPTCGPDDPLEDVMETMTRQRLRHLVVTDQGRILGVISVGDLVKHRLGQLETEAGVLRDYVAAHRAAF